MGTHRVVITGMGVVSPVGTAVEAFRDALLSGTSGIGPITIFDPATLNTRIAAEVKVPVAALLSRGPLTREEAVWAHKDRKVAFALEAARQAMESAGLAGGFQGDRTERSAGGVSLGVGLELFSMDDLARSQRPGFNLPEDPLLRRAFLQTPSDVCASLLTRRYGLGTPPLIHVSACAAGTDAIGAAFRLVRDGRRRFMLAGGTDSMINPLGVAGFCKLSATSTRNDAPSRASRPFDRRRDGFVLGEGAAVVVLERLDDARHRGAAPLAEIVGYGNSFDAHGISEPHPEARGALQAMTRALRDAGLSPDHIDAVNAHGTSTPKNDPVETLAYKRLFGARAGQVPIVATKSMIGHLISAAGAVELVAAVAMMAVGRLHPTLNLDEADPACDLDYVPHQARAVQQTHVLSNSFAFGGQNASLVIRKSVATSG